MKLIKTVAALLVAAIAMTGPAFAESKPTMDEVKALTLKAAEMIDKSGVEGTVATFNTDPAFKYGEVYVNVIDYDGVWLVYPPRPEGVGKSVLNVKDPDGKFLVKDIIATAKEKGEGWVEYRWLNPTSNKIEPKVTFVKHVPSQKVITYVGIYK